nr:MAG TPA: hypothetical protein [Caudoviricetes sp.]
MRNKYKGYQQFFDLKYYPHLHNKRGLAKLWISNLTH